MSEGSGDLKTDAMFLFIYKRFQLANQLFSHAVRISQLTSFYYLYFLKDPVFWRMLQECDG